MIHREQKFSHVVKSNGEKKDWNLKLLLKRTKIFENLVSLESLKIDSRTQIKNNLLK